MNKGLKLNLYNYCFLIFHLKRNTDLMNKGLKLTPSLGFEPRE